MFITVAPFEILFPFLPLIWLSRENSGTDICSDGKLSDLCHSDDAGILSEDPSRFGVLLGHLKDSLDRSGMRFTSSKSKMLFFNWISLKPSIVLARSN